MSACHRFLIALVLSIVAVGCNDTIDTAEPARGPIGKADAAANSCYDDNGTPVCGGLAPGGVAGESCWCDSECTFWGDCCSDAFEACGVGEPAACLGSNANVDCAGNEICESCLNDGECADGPNPIWRDNKCMCMGDDRLDCQLAWCCAPNQHWDAAACEVAQAAGLGGDFCVRN